MVFFLNLGIRFFVYELINIYNVYIYIKKKIKKSFCTDGFLYFVFVKYL